MADTVVVHQPALSAFRELLAYSERSPVLAAEVREFLDRNPLVAKIDVVPATATRKRVERYEPADALARFLAALRARYGQIGNPGRVASVGIGHG